MEDYAKSMPPAGADTAYTVAHIDPIPAFRAPHRPVMNREDHGISLVERHHLRARLHTRSLLRQHKFSAAEIFLWIREKESNL